MSTNKRQSISDEAAKRNGGPHSASPRKKLRSSSFIEVDRDRRHVKADAIQDEGARPSERNKRSSFGHLRPGKVPTPLSPNSFPYSGPPELFDVTPGLLDAMFLADDESPFWDTDHAAFIKSAAGLENENWLGKRPLGSGSFGTAGLWELRDDNNVVIEQIVIKESKTITVEKWTGEVPEEVKMMRRLNKTGCQAVPKLIAYKRYMHVRKHRIYMEYCPYGDLVTLNVNYKRFRTYFPEPFLWHTFNNLVKVAAAMENGPDDTNWGYRIVHRDLKPANIFLGVENKDSAFSSYPVAKTGDWGLAIKIKHGDQGNPIGLRGAGTQGYYAPEQRLFHSGIALTTQMNRHLDGTAPLPKISAHTNIWGIGAIMFELLTHEAVVYYLTDDEWTVNEAFFDIPNVRTPRYSGALTELIKLCLMPEPWDRPSIEELELKIGAKCQRIMNEYTANPSLQKQDRLYYAGSEINQMPPGDWNYWNPVVKDVPKPSDLPDPKEPRNPFTETIKYPPFPTSELDGPEEEGGEVQETRVKSSDDDDDKDNWRYDGNDEDIWRDDDDDDEDTHHEASERPRVDGVGKPIVVSDGTSSGRNGNDLKDPVVISDSDEEDELHERSERNEFNRGDEVDEGEEDNWANENNERNPVVISDSDEEDKLDERSERNEVKHCGEGEEGSWANENNESNWGDGSEDESSSDDSDARRRMAIKKPPGI